MNRLQGKVAIITGGANGIGKGTAQKFLAEGASVAIWDISDEKGQAFVAEMEAQGYAGKLMYQNVNTTNLAASEAAAAAVHAAFGQIDIVVNNAGITRDASFAKMSSEQWDAVIAVNLTGVFNSTKAVLPYMLERSYGRIITASSVVGLYGNFGQTNYAATKFGVIGMTKSWARELGRKGITANAVAPGFINTEMVAAMPEKVVQMMREKAPVQRLGEVEDIANAYLFLASDEASFINGAVLSVDGGLTL